MRVLARTVSGDASTPGQADSRETVELGPGWLFGLPLIQSSWMPPGYALVVDPRQFPVWLDHVSLDIQVTDRLTPALERLGLRLGSMNASFRLTKAGVARMAKLFGRVDDWRQHWYREQYVGTAWWDR